MGEELTVPVYPVLTTEQQLAVRNAQFNLSASKETAARMVESASQALLSIVAEIAKGYGVNPETTLFRQEDLTFVDKP
jgi:hypothetical protein